jgi:serine protease SohB
VEFLAEYASFLAKTVTLVVAIVVVLVTLAALRGKGRRTTGQLQVIKLNDFYKGLRERLEQIAADQGPAQDAAQADRQDRQKAEKTARRKA